MPDNECFREIGSLESRIEHLEEVVRKQSEIIGSFEADRNRLIGIGSAMSLALVAVGFLFGESLKTWVNRAIQ